MILFHAKKPIYVDDLDIVNVDNFVVVQKYGQSWSAALNESPKCLDYRIIMSEHKFENYLI